MFFQILLSTTFFLMLTSGSVLSLVLFLINSIYFDYVILDLNLLSVGSWEINIPLFFDLISNLFLSTVFLISAAIMIFSMSYMANEKFYLRFIFLVALFVLSMALLILSPSFVSLLLGWDGLGVTSFLLVAYFFSHKSYNASMITAMSNRIGDCLILVSIGVVSSMNSFYYFLDSETLFLGMPLSLMVVVAATTKSAQVPFSAWLPAAMAAPTPVSSLVHSSTLVTAGVFLLIRFGPTLGSFKSLYLSMVGPGTMILAGVAALYESDMKKVVALSTLSQLGLMITAISFSLEMVAFFHLLTHAFFKALLFITVGNLIHLNSNYQDLRFTSSNSSFLSPTIAFSMVANFSLMGLPFTSGFFSKDLILESSLIGSMNSIVIMLVLLATFFTAAYTIRFLRSIMWGISFQPPLLWSEDNDLKMSSSMSLLWPLAIMGGAVLSWFLFYNPTSVVIQSPMKLLIPLVLISGGLLGCYFPLFLNFYNSFSWSWGSMWALPFFSGVLSSISSWGGSKSYSLMDLKWTLLITSSMSLSPYSLGEITSHLSSFKNVLFLFLSVVVVLIY